jgi:hypothetical protein
MLAASRRRAGWVEAAKRSEKSIEIRRGAAYMTATTGIAAQPECAT